VFSYYRIECVLLLQGRTNSAQQAQEDLNAAAHKVRPFVCVGVCVSMCVGMCMCVCMYGRVDYRDRVRAARYFEGQRGDSEGGECVSVWQGGRRRCSACCLMVSLARSLVHMASLSHYWHNVCMTHFT